MKNPETTLIRAGTPGQEFEVRHPLNPDSQLWMRPLGRLTGLQRVGVSLARVPPGKESFIYHSHQHEEEFVYILAGRGIAEIEPGQQGRPVEREGDARDRDRRRNSPPRHLEPFSARAFAR